jgi:predicted PurR-regulated permease PerM
MTSPPPASTAPTSPGASAALPDREAPQSPGSSPHETAAVPTPKTANDSPAKHSTHSSVERPIGATPYPGAEGIALRLPATSDPADPDEPRILLLQTVDVRNVSLMILAVLASVLVLRWAAPVFIPLLLALMMTYALSPAVEWLFRRHVPRALSAAVILLLILGSIGACGWWLSDDAVKLVNSLPVAASKLRTSMEERHRHQGKSTLDTVQQAANQITEATKADKPANTPRGVTRVVVEKPSFNIRDYVVSGTIGLAAAIGQLIVVVFLTYFALCAGDNFRRKLVRLTGPTLTKKRVTVEVLNEITDQIHRYLVVQVAMSVVVGFTTGLAFWAMGLNYAPVWGIISGVLNLVPYAGAIAITGASALVGFTQFGTPEMGIAVGAASLFIHTIVGQLLTPWLTSRASAMNPVVVFASVLAWGWLWGIWGLLLGIPIMMVIKAICDRVDDLRPVGELMSA